MRLPWSIVRGAKRATVPRGTRGINPFMPLARALACSPAVAGIVCGRGLGVGMLGGRMRALKSGCSLSRAAGAASPAKPAGFRGETALRPEVTTGLPPLRALGRVFDGETAGFRVETSALTRESKAAQGLFFNGCSASEARQLPMCATCEPVGPSTGSSCGRAGCAQCEPRFQPRASSSTVHAAAISRCSGDTRIMRKHITRASALLAGLGASVSAFAVDPTTALEGFTTASTAATGFGPGMWGLAASVVGIMIGVKWIKRARGAA